VTFLGHIPRAEMIETAVEHVYCSAIRNLSIFEPADCPCGLWLAVTTARYGGSIELDYHTA
jgi:hypothetical protein